MKLIKWFLNKFSPIEIIILMISLTISTFLLIPAFSKDEGPSGVQILLPTEEVYNTEGGRPVDIFDTYFFIRYEEADDAHLDAVRNALNEYLVPYHKLFDRHNDYFAVSPLDPRTPTVSEKETLPLIHNLKYVNDHQGEVVEIAKPLYDLLSVSKEYTLNTPQNAFNMFIGGVYDFWKPHINSFNAANDPLNNMAAKTELEELASYIPLSATDIENTLKLWTEGDKYYVTLNEFNNSGTKMSISVGAVAKGMMTDILQDALISKGLTRGYINGGTSSITLLGNGFNGKPLNVTMSSINTAEYSYKFSRADQYQMSTSGIYEGFRFTYNGEEIIRSHIINPLTGYPAQQNHHVVNISSNSIRGLELDYLTTTLVVLSEAEGLAFLRENYLDQDLNVAYGGVDETGWYIAHTHNYPGGSSPLMSVNSAYREIFLDFLQ